MSTTPDGVIRFISKMILSTDQKQNSCLKFTNIFKKRYLCEKKLVPFREAKCCDS